MIHELQIELYLVILFEEDIEKWNAYSEWR